jgi:multidrug efflux pump subunit AcrB
MSLIPITIFTTLLASLFVSLTITPTIFFLVSKDKKKYTKNPESEQYLLEDEKLLLENDRINKIEKKDSNEDSFRDRVLDKLVERYEKLVD